MLDHFNPPLNRTHPWRSFHGAWAAAMARLLNAAILGLLGADTGAARPTGLSAVSYRAVGRDQETQQLQLWPAPLALGQPLPTLPLWIASDLSVPLDLEASYKETCTDLRIRQVG